MAVSANIGVYQPYQPEDTVVSGHHSPIYKTKKVKIGQGVLDAGLIVAVDSNGEVVPYEIATVDIGTGNGTATDFTGTFTKAPVLPGSVVVTDGTQTLRDDGCGRLYGDGTGTVNYETGTISVSFGSAPAADVTVSVTAARKVIGVLVERCDTDKEDATNILVHGTVFRDRIKKADGTALTADDEKALEAIGIYPMP